MYYSPFFLNNLLLGFIGSILTFCSEIVTLASGGINLFPKWLQDAIGLLHLPDWLGVFFRNDWVVVLIGGALGSILIVLIGMRIAMRIVNLINPMS